MKHSLTKHPTATIYQYKHVKRISIRAEMLFSYLVCAVLLLGIQFLIYDMYGIFSSIIGFVAIQFIHLLIILLTFISVSEATDRKWTWSIVPPWTGFKPANDINYSVFRKVHSQMFWLGLIIVAVMYPWLPSSLMISLMFWHIWLLAPKLMVTFIMRKSMKRTRVGIIRVQNKEVNLFQP